MDTVTPEKRSFIMSRIRGCDTKPEELVRKSLFALGYRFRKNDKRYPGKPDVLLPKYRTAVFVNGCFWHGHQDCRLYVVPKSNVDFWKEKVARNAARDAATNEKLEEMGWHVLTVWECQLKKKVLPQTIEALDQAIRQNLEDEMAKDVRKRPKRTTSPVRPTRKK